MKRFLVLMLALVMILSMVVGCSPKEADKGSGDVVEDGGKTEEKLKIALLCDVAGTQIFVLNMIDGLKDSAKEHGFEAIIAESGDSAAYEDNARALIEEGVDLIIGGGWMSGEAINKMALEFPDEAQYALIDSEVEAENVKCISYTEQESAYLVGMIGAMVTEENEKTFGAVHVDQGAGSWKWRYGYMEGVKAIKPDSKFIFNYVGDFNDPAKAKEYSLQQYEQGARFINAACAGGDKGVFEGALEKGFYTSGQDVDLTSPDNKFIVSSQIKDTYATVQYLVDSYLSDENWSGENETWGVEEGTIGAVHVTHESANPITDRLTEEDLVILKQAAADMLSGKLDLKNIPDEADYK